MTVLAPSIEFLMTGPDVIVVDTPEEPEKLSALLRQGAQDTEHMRCRLLQQVEDGRIYACALGAIYYAKFGFDKDSNLIDAVSRLSAVGYPQLRDDMQDRSKLPVVTGNHIYKLYQVIIDLNDNCLWDRDRVADWLESIGE